VAALDAINAERGKPIVVRQIEYLNSIVEQDRRASNVDLDRCSASKILAASATFCLASNSHMIRKGQMKDGGQAKAPPQHFYSRVQQ
jgi:putative transposase